MLAIWFQNTFTKLTSNPFAALSALYVLVYAPLLLMRGVYWDSWVWYTQFVHHDYERIFSEYLGPPRVEHFYAFFRVVDFFPDPIFVERTIIFISWLFAGLLVFYIFREILAWSTEESFLFAAYYSVFPVYLVRFDLMVGYHSFANLCFVASCAILLSMVARRTGWAIFLEIATLPLLCLAFLVNSYPFFFIIPLVVHVWLFAQRRGVPIVLTVSALKVLLFTWLRHYWYLAAIPPVFMLWRLLFMVPYGEFVGYNKILLFEPSFSVYTNMLENFWTGFYSIIWPIASALLMTERKFFVVGVLLAAIAVLALCRRYLQHSFEATMYSRLSAGWMMVLGVLFAIIALTPYVLVGKTPHVYGYGFGLRHGLLLGLPAAFLTVGIIRYVVLPRVQYIVHVSFLSLSIGFVWFNFFLLDMDWYKQQSVLYNLRTVLEDAPQGSVIVFTDRAPNYNWRHRGIGRQEYQGWLDVLTEQKAFMGVSHYDFTQGAKQEERAAPNRIFVDIYSERSLSEPVIKEWVHLKLYELTHSGEELRAEADRVLRVKVKKSATEDERHAVDL